MLRRTTAWLAVVGLAALAPIAVSGQSTTTVAQEVRVAAGETMTLPASRHLSWYLDTLVMGDGATLRLAAETKAFFLRTHDAEIGQGARIIGAGSVAVKRHLDAGARRA
jgi:hypothetical protein